VVYETWGKTEAKVMNEGADIGLEITQSGSAIKNYGLKIIETIMESETGIYINPAIKENKEKTELLRMFLLNLYGSVNAENKVMIVFNVPNKNTETIEKYLSDNNLFADEPTVNRGHEFTEYSIQVSTTDKKMPLAKLRYDLALLKAKHIDTIPINSSIPGIDVIDI
jgi:ATP phosphoribosyltransferase